MFLFTVYVSKNMTEVPYELQSIETIERTLLLSVRNNVTGEQVTCGDDTIQIHEAQKCVQEISSALIRGDFTYVSISFFKSFAVFHSYIICVIVMCGRTFL